MAKPQKKKKYIFDMYQLSSDSDDLFSLPVDECLNQIISGEVSSEYTSYGCTRDIYGLQYRQSSSSFSGQIRKIRKADLPEVGEPGQDGKKIILNDREGVIEKNFFVYHKENSLLIMHRNDNGNNGVHLAQLLTETFGSTFFATPLIQPEQVERLLSNKIKIKKFTIKIPKPTNPALYPQNSLSATTLELLNKSDADNIDITFSVDSKLSTSNGRLSSALQSAIRPLLSFGATKANIETDENGMIHPIDLIANRIYSTQTITTNASFPPSESMYNLADKAKADKKEIINAYFSNNSNRIV